MPGSFGIHLTCDVSSIESARIYDKRRSYGGKKFPPTDPLALRLLIWLAPMNVNVEVREVCENLCFCTA
jgi:hypothetical protein